MRTRSGEVNIAISVMAKDRNRDVGALANQSVVSVRGSNVILPQPGLLVRNSRSHQKDPFSTDLGAKPVQLDVASRGANESPSRDLIVRLERSIGPVKRDADSL
jgi:hypothetical protein